MSQYFTGDWADFTTCSGAACGDWTLRYRTSTPFSPANPVVTPGSGASDWTALTWNDVDGDANRGNVELLFKASLSATPRHVAIVRGSGADESASLYSIYLGGTALRVYYCAGTDTPTQVATVARTHSVGATYWVRFRINGSGPTTVQAKSWTGLITDEPGTWQIDTTDSSGPTAAGWIGPSDYNLGGGATIYQFGVGTNGDSAPDTAPSSGLAIVATPGNATASGPTAAISRALALAATPGNASAAGVSALISQALAVSATPGNAAASGPQAKISLGTGITATPGNATAAGVPATISFGSAGLAIVATPGNATASGPQARVSLGTGVVATPGNATASGPQATIVTGLVVVATPGNATAAGVQAKITTSLAISATPGSAVAAGVRATIATGGGTASTTVGGGFWVPEIPRRKRKKGEEAEARQDLQEAIAKLVAVSTPPAAPEEGSTPPAPEEVLPSPAVRAIKLAESAKSLALMRAHIEAATAAVYKEIARKQRIAYNNEFLLNLE